MASTEDHDLEAAGRAAIERARRDVELYGWHVVMIQGDEEPGFLFTIGLWQSYRHPEIVLFAPSDDPSAMAGRIQPVAERVSDGEVFEPGTVHENLFGRFPGAFRTVDRFWYPWFLGTAMAFYGGVEFPVLQLFWPDRAGTFPWDVGFSSELYPFQPLLFETTCALANLPPSVLSEIEDAGNLRTQTLSASDLFIEVDDGKVDLLLEEWRWLVGPEAEILRITIFGDLFLSTPDGHVHWLDTGSGTYQEVACSVKEWGREAQARGPAWFHLKPLLDLRETGAELAEDQVYSWIHPPMLGGEETAGNINLMDVQAHVSLMGRIAHAIKDLPPGTPVSGVNFEPV
jgi:hypothetical protein